MTALSIKLPDELAETSRRIAEQIGISRSEFIRRALMHEIESTKARLERQGMAESLRLMGQSRTGLAESETLDEAFGEPLYDDEDGWWNG